jgi:acyl transferase domain-containing protein
VLNGALPWPVAGRTEAHVAARARRVAEHVRAHPELDPADVGYTLATEPAAEHRAVVVGPDREHLLAGLDALAEGRDDDAVVRGTARPSGGVVLVFAGAGGQWRGMGGGLWDDCPVFRDSVRACAEAFEPYVDWSLVDVLRGRRGAASLNRVDVVQPALFTLTVSLAAVWRSFGVRPAAVVGHSQGEIAAACVAGALSLPDAARVVALRSRIIAETLEGKGAMLSVPLPAARVRERLATWGDRLAVAAVNGPATTSVAGQPDAVEELFAQLVDEGVRVARIVSGFASHSAQVDDIRDHLLDAMGDVRPRSTEVVYCSAVTGGVLDTADLDAEYWYHNLRLPVEFDGAVRTLLGLGHTTFVEPSSHPLLTAPVEEIAADVGVDVTAVGSLRMGESDAQRMLTSLAAAHVRGVPVDWTAAYPGRTRVDLPTDAAPSPFWTAVARGDLAGGLGIVLPALARQPTNAARWHGISWEPLPEPAPGRQGGVWLLALPAKATRPPVAAVVAALQRNGIRVVPRSVGAPPASGPFSGVLSLRALGGGAAATLDLLRELHEAGIGAPLWSVTQQAGTVNADQATVWGLGRIAAVECPDRWGGVIDLPAVVDDRAGDLLAAVLTGSPGEQLVAVRASGLSAPRHVPAEPPTGEPWRPTGTVLVTGDVAGEAGRSARRLADAGAERVLLADPRGHHTPGAEGLAANITVAACDTTDPFALERLVAGAEDLTAVVHTIRVSDDVSLDRLTARRNADAMRATVDVAAWLHQLTRDRDLAAFVLFSFPAATASQAAANAFLEALARQRRAAGLPATAIACAPGEAAEHLLRAAGHPEAVVVAPDPSVPTRHSMEVS